MKVKETQTQTDETVKQRVSEKDYLTVKVKMPSPFIVGNQFPGSHVINCIHFELKK